MGAMLPTTLPRPRPGNGVIPDGLRTLRYRFIRQFRSPKQRPAEEQDPRVTGRDSRDAEVMRFCASTQRHRTASANGQVPR
jgi:hypothetical protein